MDQGTQLSMKCGEVLINVYEPDNTKMDEAIATLKYLHTKMGELFPPKEEVPFVTNPQTETLTPQLPKLDGGFCKICGSKKDRWIPAGISKATQKPYDGFFACPKGCKSK